MHDWKKIALIIILFGGGVIAILSGVAIGQKIKQQKLGQEQQSEIDAFAAERARADLLLTQVQKLKTETEAMVAPQVKLNLQP